MAAQKTYVALLRFVHVLRDEKTGESETFAQGDEVKLDPADKTTVFLLKAEAIRLKSEKEDEGPDVPMVDVSGTDSPYQDSQVPVL